MRWVAMLRGVGPGDPRMRNENLRTVCRDLGFQNVSTVISSGNIVFDTKTSNTGKLETQLEQAWSEQLGFESATIVRSQEALLQTVRSRPFGDLQHGGPTYLLATFSKRPVAVSWALPHQPTAEPFEVVATAEREIFTVTDTSATRTPDVMSWLEREFGKTITSRTWLTVQRIFRKMGVDDI